jgi:hypothetical protein
MITNERTSPNQAMAARFRLGEGRRGRTRSDVGGDNGEDDVVKVRLVKETADPPRIRQAGMGEWDEACEQAEHQECQGRGHSPLPVTE